MTGPHAQETLRVLHQARAILENDHFVYNTRYAHGREFLAAQAKG